MLLQLPLHTHNNRIYTLHDDNHGTRKLFSSLQQLSRTRLSYILYQLHAHLEQVIKDPAHSSTQYSQFRQDPLNGLRSQALLLQMIQGCLQWHWKNTTSETGADPAPLEDRIAKQLLGTVTFFLRQYYGSFSHANLAPDISSLKSSGQTQPRTSESSTNIITSPQSVSGKSMNEHGTPALAASSQSGFTNRFRKVSNATPASMSDGHDAQFSFSPLLRTLKQGFRRRDLKLFSASLRHKNAETIIQDCLISCFGIVQYLSASRWDIILVRLRNKLNSHWSAAIAAASGATHPDDLPDMSEVHLLEFSHLDDVRLAAVLAELAISFGSLRKTVQPILASVLNSVITRFVNQNPRIYYAMYEDGKRLSFAGQPELLFDAIFSVGDSIQRRSATWPALAILLPLCPEIVMQIAMGGGDTRSPMLSKKVLFLDALRKGVRSSTGMAQQQQHGQIQQALNTEAKLALECYTEICRAASFSRPLPGRPLPPLWILADEMQAELKKRLLTYPEALMTEQNGGKTTHLLEKAIMSVGRMSPDVLEKEVMPRLLHQQSHTEVQVATINVLADLLRQVDLNMRELQGSAFLLISNTFHKTVTKNFGRNTDGKATLNGSSYRAKQEMDDLDSDRNQLIIAILNLFVSSPYMLLDRHEIDLSHSSRTYDVLPTIEELVHFRPYDVRQQLALLATLMQEDNHNHIQDSILDLFLLLQSQVITMDPTSENNPQRLVLDRQRAENYYQNIDTIALALARPCLARQDSTEHTILALQAFSIFLQGIVVSYALVDQASHKISLILCLAELISLLHMCSVDYEIRSCAMAIIQMGASIEAHPSENVTNLSSLAASMSQESGPLVGGHMAQMKRLMKIFRAIIKPSMALSAAWAELYSRWQDYAGTFGMQAFEDHQEKTLAGIEMSFIARPDPNEVSFCKELTFGLYNAR